MRDTQQLIRELTEYRNELLKRRDQLVRQIEEDLEHVTATINALSRSAGGSQSPIETLAEFPIGQLKGLTQVQSLVSIARHNGGIVRAQEAKRLLIKAGVMRETKNSTNIIHATILRSEKFERVAPGEYRLKSETQQQSSLLHGAPVQ